ncbi:MAG: class I SAM-dependent methyltransferase [Deltaproteobacteria bacterium]|nr:class I SAM-dependent methyltransferase [Deltaproteobacteria bacterium]
MKLNWAERWAVNNPLRPIQQRLEMAWFAKRAGIAPGSRILEVGCGRGAGARLIREAFRPSELHAMDLDIAMIGRAGRYLDAGARRGITFFVGDCSRLPCRDRSFDALFGFGVLHHIPDWQGALAEIVRVLRPGGTYAFEELYPALYGNVLTKQLLLHPAGNRFRSGDLRQAMASTGLDLRHGLEHPKLGILGIAVKCL